MKLVSILCLSLFSTLIQAKTYECFEFATPTADAWTGRIYAPYGINLDEPAVILEVDQELDDAPVMKATFSNGVSGKGKYVGIEKREIKFDGFYFGNLFNEKESCESGGKEAEPHISLWLSSNLHTSQQSTGGSRKLVMQKSFSVEGEPYFFNLLSSGGCEAWQVRTFVCTE